MRCTCLKIGESPLGDPRTTRSRACAWDWLPHGLRNQHGIMFREGPDRRRPPTWPQVVGRTKSGPVCPDPHPCCMTTPIPPLRMNPPSRGPGSSEIMHFRPSAFWQKWVPVGPGTEVSPCPVLHRAVMEGNGPAMRRAYQAERANDRIATVSFCSSSSLQNHISIFNHGHRILQRASSRYFLEIFLRDLLEANERFSMHCTRGRCS